MQDLCNDTQGNDAEETEAKVNDPTIYTEAAIRHLPELLRGVVSHAVKCEDTDCGVCAVFNAILTTHGQQAEQARADQAHFKRQEAHDAARQMMGDD